MKKTLFILLLICPFIKMKAQVEYMHSFGAAIYTDITNYAWPGGTYHARLNFTELGDMALSVGARPAIGFYYNSNDYYGENYLGFDFPVTVDINGGMGTTSGDDDGVGFFAGAGVEYSLLVGLPGFFGPTGNAGIRASIFEQPLELRVGYMYDITGTEVGQLTVGLSRLLGF
ncbi:MAG: hypothetical protein H7Y00_07195 [Fimbriimonadaceae bacterium]|nr:hypothetical protein [Chitinophagales bacterium]